MEAVKTKGIKSAMILALKENFGDVTAACDRVGISRTTHYEWVKKDLPYKEKSIQQSIEGLASKRRRVTIERANENGYVYLVHCLGTEFYKIGMSKIDYEARLSTMQSGCPYELILVDAIHSTRYKSMEIALHHMLKAKRVRGEWFNLDESSLKEIKSYFNNNSQPQSKIEFE
jgi:hypothetical protein